MTDPASAVQTPSGLFIVLEGGEGVGKSTQWQRLASLMESAGQEVVALREPGGTPVGDTVRAVLLHPESDVAPTTEALLFATSRAQLVRSVIQPALLRGAVVLVDRFLLSTYAYQGAGRGLALESLQRINEFATDGLAPDVTLLLDMPLEHAMARMAARGSVDRLEQAGLAFHQRVQAAFAEATTLAWQQRHPEIGPVYIVDATGTPDDVTARCMQRLSQCFPHRFSGVTHG
jgi:dTMP kinase